MTQVTKTQAIKAFLMMSAPVDLATLYTPDMEVQVTVAKDNGERTEGDFKGKMWHGYTDGIQVWKPIRIPRNANTDPVYEDTLMTYDLVTHAEGVGMTGWDWANRVSRWVAFDFDAIIGHSDKHAKKLTEEELLAIQNSLQSVPTVTIRKSTGGKGLHLYVFLQPTKTDNHNEHAAVARAILSQLSGIAGFDFTSKVDICVPAETWTLTSEGPRQVSDLIGKSCTLVVDGRKYATAGFFRTRREMVYELETEEGYKVQATGDHKLLVHYDFNTDSRSITNRKKWGTNHGFDAHQEMLKLKPGDMVYLNRHIGVEWGGEGSYEEGYLCGLLYGDGCVFKNSDSGRIQFFPSDEGMVQFAESCFSKPYFLTKKSNGSFVITSPEFIELRHKFGFDDMKQITSHMESASSDFLCGFLSGFFDCDGDVSKDSVRLAQSDLARLEVVQRTLLRLGVKSTVNLEKAATRVKIMGFDCDAKAKYRLCVYSHDIKTFNQRVGFRHPRKRQLAESLTIQYRNEDKFLTTVKSVTEICEKEVYCVTVPEIHHFDANGLFCSNCGGNMWVWHRKLKTAPDGLQLIKQATQRAEVPANWRDYTKVVAGRRQKNLPRFIEGQVGSHQHIESVFEELTGQRVRAHPEIEHKKVMDWLFTNYGSCSWWDAEHHMLVTHTHALKECHTELNLRGKFETSATGTEKGYDHNCFAFPIARGSWAVRRYTLGVSEHPFWEQDGAGWTRCFYNREPDLGGAARIYEGIEKPDGGYHFATAEQAQKAALLLGADLKLPTWILGCQADLKMHKSGRLVVEVEKPANTAAMPDWIVKSKKATRIFSIKSAPPNEAESFKLDEQLRHIVGEDGLDAGWVIKCDGDWIGEPFQHVKVYLQGQGYQPKDVAGIMGSNIQQCWRLVNRPFREEYPKDRQWNRNAAQLRYKPSLDRDSLSYPNWTKILTHCGTGLDEAVRAHHWCKSNGIITGADWLKCWIASIFQEPNEPLPYVFFYGPQDSGKSIFHEALSLLMTRGVVRADTALTSQSGFNGELENAVLCVVEETNLQKNLSAYNRIKDWVTSRQLPVHKKQRQPYSVQNTTHWIQCANSHLACPVFPGDTRITMILVDSLKAEEMIPKKQFLPMLEKEAPDFVAELLNLELPASNDRLNIPCIGTEDKALAEHANQTFLEMFITEKCYHSPGHRIKFGDFYARFTEWLDPQHVHLWTSIRVGRELPPRYAKGRMTDNVMWIGNISFEPKTELGPRYVPRDGKLVQDGSDQVCGAAHPPK